MENKKPTFLQLYQKWVITGKLPGNSGLCNAFSLNWIAYDYLRYQNILSKSEIEKLYRSEEMGDFTPLRQNIVLFIAAINEEL